MDVLTVLWIAVISINMANISVKPYPKSNSVKYLCGGLIGFATFALMAHVGLIKP